SVPRGAPVLIAWVPYSLVAERFGSDLVEYRPADHATECRHQHTQRDRHEDPRAQHRVAVRAGCQEQPDTREGPDRARTDRGDERGSAASVRRARASTLTGVPAAISAPKVRLRSITPPAVVIAALPPASTAAITRPITVTR